MTAYGIVSHIIAIAFVRRGLRIGTLLAVGIALLEEPIFIQDVGGRDKADVYGLCRTAVCQLNADNIRAGHDLLRRIYNFFVRTIIRNVCRFRIRDGNIGDVIRIVYQIAQRDSYRQAEVQHIGFLQFARVNVVMQG